jgi:hypothetical protein
MLATTDGMHKEATLTDGMHGMTANFEEEKSRRIGLDKGRASLVASLVALVIVVVVVV